MANNIDNKRLIQTNIIKLNHLLLSNDFVAVSCAGFPNPAQLTATTPINKDTNLIFPA